LNTLCGRSRAHTSRTWRLLIILLVAMVLLAACGRTPADAPPSITSEAPGSSADTSDPTETIVILYTNDFHGAVEPEETQGSGGTVEEGGLVNLVSLIDQLRAEHPGRTLLLDAGDTFQGSYVSNSTQGELVMDAMNVAGYDGWTLGNHEFDWGQEALRARIAQAGFPVLAANIVDQVTGEPWDQVQPYAIVEVGRLKIGILGLTYPDTPAINRPENVAGLEFEQAEETVRRYLPELQEQADLIVVLSHLGYDGDLALAKAVDGLDLIVGGHSHMFLESPRNINNTLIVQAGAKGQVVGRLELTVDVDTGEVVDFSSRKVLVPVTGNAAAVNEEVKSLVDAALAEAAETIEQPIGETAVALQPQSTGEFALGNLVVDAMLAADVDGQTADIAMHNNGGIRAPLPKGPISFGQLYAVLPFDNQLMALDLTGEQVLRILEHSVSNSPGKMLVAGMTFRFDMSRPAGNRIVEAAIAGVPLDPARLYRVVTIDYLASGGDGQETFLEGINPAYGDTAVWAVAQYIQDHSPVHPKVEGRIVQE
jgi:5'-nucleotidase/UDP-sugar diphosphatase